MGEYIARYLGVPFVYARHLQKTYYRQFGTTLSRTDEGPQDGPQGRSSTTSHDLDLSVVSEHPELARRHRRAARPQVHLHQRLA